MFQGLSEAQLQGAVEALLFVTDEPVSVITLSETLQADPEKVQAACEALAASLNQADRGIQLREVAGGWRLCTHPAYHELLENYVLSWDTRKLSQAGLEVLAIIAYAQPVTRNGVANVRGVHSESSINSLVEKGLVKEVGTEDSPGNPILYGTTKSFLEKFGLRSLDDLPDIGEFAPDDETREFIRARLSATRGVARVGFGEDDSAPTLPLGDVPEQMSEAMHAMMNEALAQAAGVVEKIDFDDLEFED